MYDFASHRYSHLGLVHQAVSSGKVISIWGLGTAPARCWTNGLQRFEGVMKRFERFYTTAGDYCVEPIGKETHQVINPAT